MSLVIAVGSRLIATSTFIHGGVKTSNLISAWSTTIGCNGTVVGKTSNITGAWITTKNCNGTVTGDTSNIIGAWSTIKDC